MWEYTKHEVRSQGKTDGNAIDRVNRLSLSVGESTVKVLIILPLSTLDGQDLRKVGRQLKAGASSN
jgi:hypothetical protein